MPAGDATPQPDAADPGSRAPGAAGQTHTQPLPRAGSRPPLLHGPRPARRTPSRRGSRGARHPRPGCGSPPPARARPPAAVKPRARAQASWPAPMKPTLMATGTRPAPPGSRRRREPSPAARAGSRTQAEALSFRPGPRGRFPPPPRQGRRGASREDGPIRGRELWRTDQSAAGSSRRANPRPGARATCPPPRSGLAVGPSGAVPGSGGSAQPAHRDPHRPHPAGGAGAEGWGRGLGLGPGPGAGSRSASAVSGAGRQPPWRPRQVAACRHERGPGWKSSRPGGWPRERPWGPPHLCGS